MKLFVFLILLNFLFPMMQSFGQQRISLNFGAQFGTTAIKFEGLKLENLKPVFNQNSFFFGLQYRIGKYLEIGFDVFDQYNKLKFSDNQVISLNNGEYIKLKSESNADLRTISGHIGFLVPFNGNDMIQWLLSSGYNYGNLKPNNGASEYTYQEPEISIIQSNPEEKYSSAYLESGINARLSKLIDFRISFGYKYSFQPIYKCIYSIQTNEYSGTSTISSNGSGVYLGTSLSIGLIHIKKKEKKLPKYSPRFNDNNEITAIDNREVITNDEVKVESDVIDIQIWDYGKDDGDKISLFMDGNRILKKYVLTHKRKKIKVNLKPGTNKLIVYAHNLGKDPPNTASVIVDDGKKKHLLSLQSTLGECGSISIIYEP